jgi:geranylgeranyl pyrophosphate synthase
MVAGSSQEVQDALAKYGEAVGMGFQIADDLLDYRSESVVSGKPRAIDFREGCATLPLIYLRGSLSSDEEAYVRSKFGNGVADSDLTRIGDWMAERGAFAGAEASARGYADRALAALEGLPDNAARDVLGSLASMLILRDS